MQRRLPRPTGAVGPDRRQVLVIGAGALLAGCAGGGGGGPGPALVSQTETQQLPTASTLPGAPVKVAFLLPLGKGDAAKVATDLKQAGELALFEGDSSRANIALIVKDTAGTPQGAAAAAQAALAEGAELLLGPLFAPEVVAVAPLARQANVPVLAFSSDRKVAGNGVYLLSFLAGDEIRRSVAYAIAGGRRQFAALVPQTPYGSLVEQAARQAIAQSGGQLVAVEHYPLDTSGMTEPVKRLKARLDQAAGAGAPITALLLPGGQDVLPTLAPLLPYSGIDTKSLQLIGTGGWDYPNVGQEATLQGGWFAGPDPAGWRAFTERYAKSYGQPPARLASLGYDAVSLTMALAANPAGQRFTPENISRPSGFVGVDGLFRLKPDGTSERGLAVLEVQKFGPHVLDPAPAAFTVAQF